MSKEILKRKPKRTKAVENWLADEIAEQLTRYDKIAHEMNVVSEDQRE